MASHGVTLNGSFFRNHELQIAAALYLYCRNADGTYPDAELIGDIILDMRKQCGPPLPCHGVETFLRDSPEARHRAAWREVRTDGEEWREKAGMAYWAWRNKKTEIVERLAKCGELDRLAAVGGFEDVLKDSPTTGSSVRNGGGGQRGME